MRLAVVNSRTTLLTALGEVDVERASEGRFAADVRALYREWDGFRKWARAYPDADVSEQPSPECLGAVSPEPSQVIAVGLNYVDHAVESGFTIPTVPIVFTKFPSSVTAPFGELELSGDAVDWEIEVVAVIGKGGRGIRAAEAWDAVAGLTIGQDYSDRTAQFAGSPAQFSLGKSFRGFAPIGPVLVSPDALPQQMSLTCEVNGAVMQHAPLSDLIFSIPTLVEYVSHTIELRPGDLLFTGTPPGVGFGMTPPRYLRDGDVIRSRVDGLGYMEQTARAR